MAFRSLSRPSSAPSAKAFALRPFSLDLFALPFLFENYSFDIVVFFTQFCLLKKLYFTSSIAFLFGFQGSFFQGNYFRLSQGSGLRIRTYLPYRGLTPAGKSARFFSALRLSQGSGGLKWIRTIDLALIRRAL